MLTIASSGTRAMIFDHESLQADTYEVRVNEVSAGEIRVIASASSEPDETESFIPGFGNDAAIVSLLFVSVAVWHRIQRQESRASLRADESQLQRIFENLFENAVEHGDAETITVSTEVVQTDADLSVADDGSGLPEISNDLFDSGVTTADEGTGYGPSIVKQIAHEHDWEIESTAATSGGVRFDFYGLESLHTPVAESSSTKHIG